MQAVFSPLRGEKSVRMRNLIRTLFSLTAGKSPPEGLVYFTGVDRCSLRRATCSAVRPTVAVR